MEKSFSDLLRKLREKRSFTVNQLALKSGVSAAHISRLENERRSVPKPKTINKLAKVLGHYEELMTAAGYLPEQDNNTSDTAPNPSTPSWWYRDTPPTDVELEEFLHKSNDILDIGHRMRELRKLMKITVEQMADKMGVSVPTITRWENGSINFPISVLKKFCVVNNITYHDFFAVASQDLQLPPEIWKLVIDKNNYDLLKQIQAMKNKGYSNEVIIEWLKSLNNTLENIKTSGVFCAGEDLEESKKYTEQEKSNLKLKQENKKENIDISDIVLVAEAEGREKMRPPSPELQAIVKDAITVSRQRRKKNKQEE